MSAPDVHLVPVMSYVSLADRLWDLVHIRSAMRRGIEELKKEGWTLNKPSFEQWARVGAAAVWAHDRSSGEKAFVRSAVVLACAAFEFFLYESCAALIVLGQPESVKGYLLKVDLPMTPDVEGWYEALSRHRKDDPVIRWRRICSSLDVWPY